MRWLIAISCIVFAIVALIAPVAFIQLAVLPDRPLPVANQRGRHFGASCDCCFALDILTCCLHLARSTVPAA